LEFKGESKRVRERGHKEKETETDKPKDNKIEYYIYNRKKRVKENEG